MAACQQMNYANMIRWVISLRKTKTVFTEFFCYAFYFVYAQKKAEYQNFIFYETAVHKKTEF